MRSVLLIALIFAFSASERKEQYHHWRVFSHGTDGVRIDFDKEKLLSTFTKDNKIRHGKVAYKKITALGRLRSISLDDLPFLKRDPYKDEGEYRVIYVDLKNAIQFKDYPIKISWIRRITLSPWMSKSLKASVKETLESIDGCSRLKIYRSALVETEAWKKVAAHVRA